MSVALRDAMQEILAGWSDDLDPAWRDVAGGVELGFADIDPELRLEAWEPVFPARRGQIFLGAPEAAHMLRAFDDIAPPDVRCVILGQDPYPCPAFATGRAFEAGNVAHWIELEKMFSTSVRTFMQLIAAARTDDTSYAADDGWPRLIKKIDAGDIDLEPAATIAYRWVAEGVLLLNSSLTISRFAVDGDPHQTRGHLPLWRPFTVAVLRHLAARSTPIVFIAFGEQAIAAIRAAGIKESDTVACVLREHPARAEAVLAEENPFVACNRNLAAMGGTMVSW